MPEEDERILFADVLSCPEAAQAWGITEDKVKRYAREGRFLSSEARQTGKYWIITKQGMRRLFGELK